MLTKEFTGASALGYSLSGRFLGISLFVLFLFAIILSVRLLFTASDYSFGIFKLVLKKYMFGR
jgi:hypothetical protein